MTTLVVTAVRAEAEAVVAGLGGGEHRRLGPYDATDCTRGDVLVVAGGVGPAAAAAAAAVGVSLAPVELLVSMGIAGAFTSARLALGDTVLATTIVSADLGVQSPERFLDLTALGLDGGAAVTCDLARVAAVRDRLTAAGRSVALGTVLTLSTMTGTEERAAELMAAHGAVAEAMEGAGVAHVANLHGLPVLEVRTISNQVGERDRASWDLRGALSSLTEAAKALL